MAINLGDIARKNKNQKKVGSLNLSQNKIEQEEEKKNTWFNSGAFSDGYQFGDLTKTALGTAGDIAVNLGKGVVSAGESIGDLAAYAGAQVVDWLGNEKYADEVRKAAAESLTDKIFSPVDETVDKYSVLGEKSDSIANSIGNMYAQFATSSKLLGDKGNIPINLGGKKFNLPVSSLVIGASSGMSNAVNKGAEDWQIWTSGVTSGLAEAVSESLFGTFGIGGSDLDDYLVKAATDKMKSSLTKSLTRAGIKAVGEGAEEVVSYLLNYAGNHAIDYVKNTTGLSGVDIAEEFNKEEMWDNFFAGAIAAGLGGIPSTISEARGNTPGYNVNEGINQFRQNQNVNLPNPNRYSLPTYNQNVENTIVNDAVNNRVNQNVLQNNTSAQVMNSEGNIVNPNRYIYIKSDNANIDNLRKSASQYFNNSSETRNFLNTIERIIGDKDYSVVFDDSIVNSKGNPVNAQISTENGKVTIKINPNSDRAGEFLIVHEVTHGIETSDMKQLVLDFASKNPEFNQALESLKQTYGTNDVTSEVVADISGQLLGNQEFINSLTIQNTSQSRSIIRQIYESIRRLLNNLTENGRYRNFVQDLEAKWREAYRTTTSEQNINNLNNTRYSLQTLSDGTTYIQTEDNLFTKPDGTTMTQREIFNSLVGKTIEFNDGIKATIIKSLPNNKDVYNELFKRYPTYQNVNNIKSVNNKINENIVELLENSDNISPNEPDYMNRHKKNKIKSFDTREVKLYDGNNAYNLTFSIAKLNDGTYVAYAKRNLAKDTDLLNKIKKEAPTSKSRGVLPYTNTISQSNKNVKSDNVSTKYSIQENKNNTQELTDSSFYLDSNARRYEDLLKTNYIEYFRKGNGDIRVSLLDSNNNLVNQLDLWSTTDAIRQFGNNLGNQLFNYAIDDVKRIDIGNDINNMGTATDYFMTHRPTQTGLTADDITNQNVETPIPQDTYEHPEYYFQMNEKSSQESLEALKRVRGNPNAEVTIYRATPGDKINKGDWITLSKSYAEWHNQSQFNGKANVLEMRVKAKDIQYAGDDINEFGYFPNENSKNSISNKTWQDHLEKNYKATGTRTDMRKLLPTQEDIRKMELKDTKLPTRKILNPTEISNLTKEDANTTPILPNVNRNRVNDGESRFASNIRNKTNMLNEQQKNTILSNEEVNYYDTITNEDSLNEAFSRLNENGEAETLNWFSKESEEATAVDVAEGWILLKQYADNNNSDGMVAVAKKLRDMGTKAGQTVQAFNIMARLTPEGMVKYAQSELMEAYDRMVKNKTKKWIDQHQKDFDLTPQETAAIMDIMQKVSTMPDGYEKRVELAKIQKIMTDKLPPERGAGIKSWMRISMLFNPKTQIRNIAGNAIIAPFNSFSDLFASMADKIIGSKTGYRTTGVTNIQNYVKGFKEGFYQSYNDFKQGINTRNIQGNRFEIGEGKSFNNNTAIGKALNRVDSLLSFMLDAGDRMFYEATFTNSINNQLVLNNTTEITQDMIDIATQEALSRTWQDNNNYTKFVLNVRKMLNNVNFKGYGLGDVLIPFAKTPANLTKAIVDYSPVGLVNALVKGKRLSNAIETGQFTPQMQHDFVQSLGKAVVGTMLYVAGYALAKAGIVSGESDDDKDVQNFMRNTLGVNSYSIKIGDMSFTYDWAQPIAAPLSIMANIVQKEDEDASTLETILSSLDTAGNILLEQSFMESINTALNNNDGLASGIQEAIFDLPARAVPTFMKQIADMIDGTQRTSFEYGKPLESAINSVKSKIPFLSKTLAPSVDSMGREIQKYGGNNNIFNVFFNPANVSTENISESAGEIYRLYQETGDTTIMPRVAPYYINKDGEKITMDSSQRAEYQKISGNIIEENVGNLLDNSDYEKLSDEDKSSIIKSIVDYSYNKAREEVLGLEMSSTYNKVNKYTEQGGNVSDYYLHKDEINYALDNPEKYTTILQITDYDNYLVYKDRIDEIRDSADNKKMATINYINSLRLSIPQKAMFIRLYYSSFDDYNEQIVNYINQNVSSMDEKILILTELGFTIKDGRVYW